MITIFDVVVIGAGPAGLMAAGIAAKEGARVILLEKNEKPGRKLLITGSGRCNITNFCTDLRYFANQYGNNSKYLHSIMNTFGPEETMNFFANKGLQLTVEKENNNKVFPSSNKASDVLKVLTEFLLENKVTIQYNSDVKKIIHEKKIITAVELSKKSIFGKNFIISTGGLSYPQTGSTGAGYAFARNLGHNIISPAPILVPVILKE